MTLQSLSKSFWTHHSLNTKPLFGGGTPKFKQTLTRLGMGDTLFSKELHWFKGLERRFFVAPEGSAKHLINCLLLLSNVTWIRTYHLRQWMLHVVDVTRSIVLQVWKSYTWCWRPTGPTVKQKLSYISHKNIMKFVLGSTYTDKHFP